MAGKRRTKVEWEQLIAEFERGDENIKAFCLRHSLTPSNFYKRRSTRASASASRSIKKDALLLSHGFMKSIGPKNSPVRARTAMNSIAYLNSGRWIEGSFDGSNNLINIDPGFVRAVPAMVGLPDPCSGPRRGDVPADQIRAPCAHRPLARAHPPHGIGMDRICRIRRVGKFRSRNRRLLGLNDHVSLFAWRGRSAAGFARVRRLNRQLAERLNQETSRPLMAQQCDLAHQAEQRAQRARLKTLSIQFFLVQHEETLE